VAAAVIAVVLTLALAHASAYGAMSWGANGSGQLGNSSEIESHLPVTVSGLTGVPVSSVSGGRLHSLALLSNGTVEAWGFNGAGQLGDGTTTSTDGPVPVSSLSGVTAVSAGGYHSLALLSDGTVWAWGANANGQLGNGTTTDSDVPVQVSGLTEVVAISAGAQHSLAVLRDGTVMAWGANSAGQLGATSSGSCVSGGACSTTPIAVTSLSGATGVAAGGFHSLAVLGNGKVMAWGANAWGQLGDSSTSDSPVPVEVTGLTEATAVAAGEQHSVALMSSGKVFAWGLGGLGQLGDSSLNNSEVPVEVTGLSGVTAISANGYGFHNLALKNNGTVVAWGANGNGQLGNNTTNISDVPVPVTGLTGVTSISAGGAHSLSAGQQTRGVPRLWNEETPSTRTLLRSVSSEPKNQPAALEFANSGSVEIEAGSPVEKPAGSLVDCTEVELGMTVVVNSENELKLKMPFGVAEGDNCVDQFGKAFVPTYFDTTAAGVVPAAFKITEPVAGSRQYVATITNLLLSQKYPERFCTDNLSGIKATAVENGLGALSEESAANLHIRIIDAPISVSCAPIGNPTKRERFTGRVSADFFLETMSTTTDTAFIE
jgi:alpha-tubulin suppressor-like RCC1 family protein